MGAFLSKRDMADLLISCFEGGSNYWAVDAEYIPPPGMTLNELKALAYEASPEEEKRLWRDEWRKAPLYAFLPFLPPSVNWMIRFTTEEGESAVLDPKNMREAAPRLAKVHPHLFREIKAGNADAGTADAWLQMAVFNEVIFG